MTGKEINGRIRDLCRERSWTVYRLAKESGITYSTLSTMLNQDNTPSLPTLAKLCDGFGLSMAEFFDDEKTVLSPEQKYHLERWRLLSQQEQNSIERYMDYLLSQK